MQSQTTIKVRALAYMSIFAALIAVCSWISVPYVVPFTMQTFAVFLTLLLLGGKYGTMTVSVYLLLGAVGVPVFANFGGGIGYILGNTGGYLVGFLATTLLYWVLVQNASRPIAYKIAVLVAGLFLCYALGTAWFVVFYTQSKGPVSVGSALAWCVTPYIVPDLCKLALAVVLSTKLKKFVKV